MSKGPYRPNALNTIQQILRGGSEKQRGHDEIGRQSNRLFAKKLLRNVNQNVVPWSTGGVSLPARSAVRWKTEKFILSVCLKNISHWSY